MSYSNGQLRIFVLCLFLASFVYFNWFYKDRTNNLESEFSSVPLLADELERTTYVQSNFETLDQFDDNLVAYVRTRYLIPPSNKPYNFKHPETSKKTDLGNWVRNYLKNKKNGIFIEAGANEGEFHSHTLDLEMELGWSGLLIECNPTVTPHLRSKYRKAWVAGVCISTSSYPAILNFSSPDSWTYSGRIGAAWNLPVPTNWSYFDVETVPLYTIIRAAGFHEIDFFSFDVEGAEPDILKDFPFDKIKIKMMVAEVQFLDQKKKDEFEMFMLSKGLKVVEKLGYDYYFIQEN